MNVISRNNGLSLRTCLRAALACACFASALVQASDVPNRELAATAPGPHARVAAPSAALPAHQQLERLSFKAALVDSSAFGQLRLLRDVEAKVVEATHSAGASEPCH